ncbi:hypothetical protein JCM13664_10680 [Methylothermus subterraneus]
MHLIKLFISQSFFQKLPQNWSVSREDYEKTALVYLGAFWAIQTLLMGEPAEAFVAAICELILTQVFVFIVLALARRRNWFFPTATLIMGAESLVGMFAIPWVIWLRVAEGPALLAAFYGLMLFVVWGLAVLGRIFHQVLARPASFGLGVACAYAVETYLGTLFLLVL